MTCCCATQKNQARNEHTTDKEEDEVKSDVGKPKEEESVLRALGDINAAIDGMIRAHVL